MQIHPARAAAVLAASALSSVSLITAAPASAGPARPDYCDRFPALRTAKHSRERARKGWDAQRLRTSRSAQRRVRIQSHCAPSRAGRKHVRQQIEQARHRYKKATAEPAWPTPESLGVSSSTLAAIRACESGGDYSINTGNGFYGAYQFDLGTWRSVGGSGYPHEASPAEQDYRAAKLYASRGSSPWPVCG